MPNSCPTGVSASARYLCRWKLCTVPCGEPISWRPIPCLGHHHPSPSSKYLTTILSSSPCGISCSFVNELLLECLRIMDGLCSPCIPEMWEKGDVIIDHEAAASFFMPSTLPHIFRKRSRIEPMGDCVEDVPNDAIVGNPNVMPALSQCRFPREKSHLTAAKACRRAETDTEAPGQTSVPVLLLSKIPSKDSRDHSRAEWESHKDNIEQLYKVLTLKEVMEIMERDYGFAATYVLLTFS